MAPDGRGAPTMRARAKAVNFGIIYGLVRLWPGEPARHRERRGQGDDRHLLRALRRRADQFIDDTIARARRSSGFVTTLLGRRRYLPDLTSRNRVLRQAAERMAVNTVIQGTAADLIKKAMLAVQAALRGRAGERREAAPPGPRRAGARGARSQELDADHPELLR